MNALEALKKIRDDGPVRDYVGICGNVEELTEETMPYELKELMVEWPANAAKLHSLRQNYPVEGTGMDTKQIQRPKRCGIIPAVMNSSTG